MTNGVQTAVVLTSGGWLNMLGLLPWLSTLLVPAMAIRSLFFLKRRNSAATLRSARRCYCALHLQSAFALLLGVGCSLYHVLSRHPAFVANSADAAFLYMSLSHLLWIVAYQCGIATLAALVIMACSGCRPRLWQPRLAIASMGLCAIAQAIALFTILSCQERQLQKERPFAGISLPQAARLPSIKDGWRRFPVAIQCNGRLSINEKPLELDAFVTSLQSAASNDNRMVDVVIGANVNASFDKVWPVLEACRSNRVWKVGFAVTDATGQGIGEIWAFLPHWESDPAAWGPLVLKDSVVPHVVCIGVQTNGFAVTERMLDANALNAYLLEVREEGGDNMTIIVHPGPGITHGQFMSVLCLCDAVGLKNVSVLNAPGKDPAR